MRKCLNPHHFTIANCREYAEYKVGTAEITGGVAGLMAAKKKAAKWKTKTATAIEEGTSRSPPRKAGKSKLGKKEGERNAGAECGVQV